MELREARIILPLHNNKGLSLAPLHLELEQVLLSHFGGFTSFQAKGAIEAPDGPPQRERDVVYDVAMCDNDTGYLRAIAVWLAQRGEQDCVYVRFPNGTVEFVSPVDVKLPVEAPSAPETVSGPTLPDAAM